MKLATLVAASVLLCCPGDGRAVEFEVPAEEAPAASLSPGQVSGPDFYVMDPVRSDGLMRHYVVDSRFGRFPAYGLDSLDGRLREVAALAEIAKTTDVGVIAGAVGRNLEANVKTVAGVARNPVGTVIGIPRGIAHLFKGYAAQARELTARSSGGGRQGAKRSATERVAADARRYADRYFGVSAAERRWYQKLAVDPYSDNDGLRRAVHHLATVDATANLGLRFAGLPGLPYAGDINRAMDAIYNEDPAVLRARRRGVLESYGLAPAEVERFNNTLLLSPTRQHLLEVAANTLAGVEGLALLFRQAMDTTTEEEVQVFIASAELLARAHGRRAIARLLPGPRLPSALAVDGRVTVFAAFDAVAWTADVADYEQALRAALAGEVPDRELWISGTVSRRAREELTALGWDVHDNARAYFAPP